MGISLDLFSLVNFQIFLISLCQRRRLSSLRLKMMCKCVSVISIKKERQKTKKNTLNKKWNENLINYKHISLFLSAQIEILISHSKTAANAGEPMARQGRGAVAAAQHTQLNLF